MTTMLRSRQALVLPAIATIGLLLVSAVLLMGYISILERGPDGGVDWGHYSFGAYTQFFYERDFDDNLVLNTDYLRIFLRSFTLAAFTALCTLLLAFPTALWMAMQKPERRTLLLFAITVPFWTNILVRTYSCRRVSERWRAARADRHGNARPLQSRSRLGEARERLGCRGRPRHDDGAVRGPYAAKFRAEISLSHRSDHLVWF